MRYCVPIASNLGLDSIICEHFGSAPHFALFDGGEAQDLRILENENATHAHGHCNPVRTLMNHDLDAVVVSGIGRRALALLSAMNITVYASNQPTLEGVVAEIAKGALEPINPELACEGHHHGSS